MKQRKTTQCSEKILSDSCAIPRPKKKVKLSPGREYYFIFIKVWVRILNMFSASKFFPFNFSAFYFHSIHLFSPTDHSYLRISICLSAQNSRSKVISMKTNCHSWPPTTCFSINYQLVYHNSERSCTWFVRISIFHSVLPAKFILEQL